MIIHYYPKRLTELLRTQPSTGGIRNALQHIWGYISDSYSISKRDVETWSLSRLFNETQQGVLATAEPYLMSSTALSELTIWIKNV